MMSMKRIRFSLRTLLLVVTAAAMLFGLYWIAWPRYQAYRERSQFEAVAKTFKAGISPEEAYALLPKAQLSPTMFHLAAPQPQNESEGPPSRRRRSPPKF